MKQEKSRLAVVMIDMQDNFLAKSKWIIPNHIEIVRFAKEYRVPLFVVEFRSGRHPSSTNEEIMKEIVKLPRSQTHWISKSTMDAFSVPKFQQTLSLLGVTEMILMGVHAGACVFSTAKTAVKKYDVITSKDLIASNQLIEKEQREKLDWYREKTVLLDSHTQVIETAKNRLLVY